MFALRLTIANNLFTFIYSRARFCRVNHQFVGEPLSDWRSKAVQQGNCSVLDRLEEPADRVVLDLVRVQPTQVQRLH